MKSLSPDEVRQKLVCRSEVALIDVREEDPFAAAHPLFASQLSAGSIEIDAPSRIPRKDVPIVIYDNGDGLIPDASRRLARIGYTNVHEMKGGLASWKAAGFEVFQDVNSYAKAFGELVESRRHTPSLSASEVQALIRSQADVRIVDARRFDEFATMSVPTATNVPGAELVLRAPSLAPDPDTTIIVNCAGRTRSIIGTQSLINAGVPNKVLALRNGTIGWTLAGQRLDTGATRKVGSPDGTACTAACERARQVAYRAGVRHIGTDTLVALRGERDRTLYQFDVRDPGEFFAGHPAGFRNAPGGQLVQEIDVYAPVRGARIVLADDLGPRADMTASWLAQMGWDVYVLYPGAGTELPGEPAPAAIPEPGAAKISVDELAALCGHPDILLIDLAPSDAHRVGHIEGARFALRAELGRWLHDYSHDRSIVLTSPGGRLAAFAAEEFNTPNLRALEGGTQAWEASGRPLTSETAEPLSPPIDRYNRPYEGTDNPANAMQAYIDWELGLVAQLERDGSHGFFVI